MAEEVEESKRIDLTVSVQTYRYLTALKKRGTHGGTVAKVARSQIEGGIREAIDKRYIQLNASDD
jgi:hypothetical protein